MNNSKLKIKKKVKKHIPKDWLCELRILYRLTMETFYDIKRTGIVNLVIITTMAAILTIFGSFFRSALSISAFAHELGNVLEISVYLKSGTDTNIAKNRIKEFEHVENVKIIPKEMFVQNCINEVLIKRLSIVCFHIMKRILWIP